MRKILDSEIVSNLLWSAFGCISGTDYYSKRNYWVSSILFLIGVVYLARLFLNLIKGSENSN